MNILVMNFNQTLIQVQVQSPPPTLESLLEAQCRFDQALIQTAKDRRQREGLSLGALALIILSGNP